MGAFTYPRSEPGSGGHQDLVERLNTFPRSLRSELAGVSEATLTARPEGGAWSIKEVCGHLRDYDQFLHRRLHLMANLEQPLLETWDQEKVMRERNPQDAPLEELLLEISGQRARTVELLSDLVHWNWARQGRHEERGRTSIRQLVDRAILHDELHLDQIRTLKKQAESAATHP